MRRFLTLVFLLFLALPAGITITGCYRNPAGNYCNGQGFGLKVTDLYAIDLEPKNTGISLAFGQTRQINAPTATTCKGTSVSVTGFAYGTTNNQLVDISPTGNMCAGTWNRNSGGGIADFTICNYPNPLPKSGGLPYGSAFVSASAQSVVSNPVQVFVHAQVSSISLVGPQSCLSQNQTAQLDAQACFSVGGQQYEMCAPSGVTTYSCPGGLYPGVASVPSCGAAIGTLSYTAGTSTVASINPETNQITALMPGTTVITASVAGSGSSAGYFSSCPPASISLTLNGNSSGGAVTQGVQQNLVTKVLDTQGNPITGLTLDYQSTNPMNVSATSTGAVLANFPGAASVYAVCQPGTCNPAPINQVGVNGTGLSIASNPVDLTVPGTASSFVWYGAPGQSQYFVPVELITGTVGSTVRLPYVPNSMVMDQTGTTLYFGSQHELMIFSTATSRLTSEVPSLPGVVLAVSPDNSQVLINDPLRKVFYLSNSSGTVASTFGGLGTSAQWTPDGKTLYITDTAAANSLPANVTAGITGHTNTLYVYNANTGWTSCSAGSACAGHFTGAQNLALTIPGVGAYFTGNPTVARTWCPSGNTSNYTNMIFYPEGDSVSTATDALAATIDGKHVLGAALGTSGITFSDIAVNIPGGACNSAGGVLQPLTISSTVNQTNMAVNATSVNQVVTSPSAVTRGTSTAANTLSFVTYNGTTAGATLPYYIQAVGASTNLGSVGYLTLTGGSSITAPVAGAFSPDDTLFFVSTAGDNKVHYINTTTLTDTQQISPGLPACTPGSDPDCTLTSSPASGVVPATVITVKPRATT